MDRCIVVTRFSHTQPGYLDFAYRIQSLTKQFEVTLVSDHKLDMPEMQIQGVRQVVLPGGETMPGLIRYLFLAARLIRKTQPECVLILHAMAAPIVYFLKGFPHALYWNEHPIRIVTGSVANPAKRLYREFVYRFLYMRAARKADLVMPIGEAHYDDLLAQGCNPERIRLVYMGVDERFAREPLSEARKHEATTLELLYTGTVKKERGRDVMLTAVEKAVRHGLLVRLTIVGASPAELEYCEEYARNHGIESAIRLHGRVPGGEIPQFIAKADVGICLWEDRPWWRFNPPTKLFEYLVGGLPVLASNIRTHTQYIKDWDNGVVFEYDSDSLYEAIRALIARQDELPLLKERARTSGAQYLWDKIEPEFMNAMNSLTTGKLCS